MIKKALFICLLTGNLHATYPYQIHTKIYTVFHLLRNAAHNPYIGEEVSQLEHALQAAHQARLLKGSNELIIAALLHDIGHQLPGKSMDGWGTYHHEHVGADFLKEQGFSPTVCELVRSHIQAKRYLCTDRTYYDNLSQASKQSMRYQNNPMNEQEAEEFKKDPLFAQKIALRHCDDRAKDPHARVPVIECYIKIVSEHLNMQGNNH